MKEVWFYLFYNYKEVGYFDVRYEATDLQVSDEFDSFDEAWESMKSKKFPASPIMKGYTKEE